MLTCHNDVIDAGQNNRLFAPGTDIDRALLHLSHMQKGTYYVQICDSKRLLHDIFHIGPGINPRFSYQARQRS